MQKDRRCEKTFVFYITNHGYGHASRNVAIIQQLLSLNNNIRVIVKSDKERCSFMQRNLGQCENVEYYSDCQEVGVILEEGGLQPDVSTMRTQIESDIQLWPTYIRREQKFLRMCKPNAVISDVVCWAIYAAKKEHIPSLLIGNFTWASMYRSFFDEDVYGKYLNYYKQADKVLLYEIHDESLDSDFRNPKQISLVTRKVNYADAEVIQRKHKQPIVFVSLGASAEIDCAIDVSSLPYDFVTTRGIELIGENVYPLSYDMINTMDYIAASDIVIAKGGWSTVSEILLQKKKCALLMRGNNTEDNATKRILEEKNHCIAIDEKDLMDIGNIITRIVALQPEPYSYTNDVSLICNEIINLETTVC